METYAKAETFIGATIAPQGLLRNIVVAVGFSLVIAVAAQIAVPLPFTPIPLTLQTLGVLLTGALLGSRLGAFALSLYLVEGAAGLPFFSAERGGVSYLLFTPATGYLLSYPVAALRHGMARRARLGS